MAIPSWSKLDGGGDKSRGAVAIDLEPDDIIEVPDAVVLPGARSADERLRAATSRTFSRALTEPPRAAVLRHGAM